MNSRDFRGKLPLAGFLIYLLGFFGCSPEYHRPPPRSPIEDFSEWKQKPDVLIGYPEIERAVKEWDSEWMHVESGNFTRPGLLSRYGGRDRVLRLHAASQSPAGPLRIRSVQTLPAGRPMLQIGVAAHDHPPGKLLLKVMVGNAVPDSREITHVLHQPMWHDILVDLSAYAGTTVTITLEGWPTQWGYACLNFSHARIWNVP